MFKNWTIGKRITAGFMSVLILLTVVTLIGYQAINSSSTGFTSYQALARGANALGLLQNDLLMSRLIVTGYMAAASEEARTKFDATFKSMKDNLKLAEGEMVNPEHIQGLKTVGTASDEYNAGFGKLVEIQGRIDKALKEFLYVKGAVIAESMTTIMTTANADGDAAAAFNSGSALQSLLLTRLAVAKYLQADEHKPAEIDVLNAGLNKAVEAFTVLDKDLKKPESRQLLANAQEALKVYQENMNVMGKALVERDAIEDNTLKRIGPEIAKEVDTIKLGIKKDQDTLGENLIASNRRAISLMLSLGIGAILLGIALSYTIVRAITKALTQVIQSLTDGATQVSSASSQVADSSQSMAAGASQQASSLEETSASIEEMSSMTRQNADNASQANSMAEEAGKAAIKGRDAMGRMSEAINRIKSSSDETAKIIKTIDEIAFQTNLLALNAAVEAARAGDAGKGFAVVAEEVRNLAQRSAQAAKTTSTLIAESQQNSENGVSVSNEVATILNQIVDGVQRVTQLVAEVSAASSEQAQGIDQINTAISEIDKVTQSNAANSEEAASASEELSAQARELDDMVNTLAALVGGTSHTSLQKSGFTPPPQSKSRVPAIEARRPQKLTVKSSSSKQLGTDANKWQARKSNHAVIANSSQSTTINPADVIPLSDDDLKDF